jgi:hypothetical protein
MAAGEFVPVGGGAESHALADKEEVRVGDGLTLIDRAVKSEATARRAESVLREEAGAQEQQKSCVQ